ncbi:MAG: SDR family oxidoreductase [Firmicutes bacterium]|nr:SDR family oxidoreductase [Bacillota bacterium]
MDFTKKIVWITGSSKGIGEATAKEFASLGASIVLHYFTDLESIKIIKQEIEEKYNVPVLVVHGDVSKEEDVSRMLEEVLSVFGHIDVLVNNAAISIDTTFEDKTVENFRRILDVNLIGTFLMSKYVGVKMLERKSGVIINISSTNGIDTVYPYSLDYDASKAGVISLTKNLAIQFAPYVRVNCIAPGWVNTPMNKNLDSEFIENECTHILLNRFADPKEIANIISMISSDKASYLNGTVIRVDGGYQS